MIRLLNLRLFYHKIKKRKEIYMLEEMMDYLESKDEEVGKFVKE